MKSPFCIKVCSKCGKILVAYSGNFDKQKGGKYGLRPECKTCRKGHYEGNKEQVLEQRKRYREENKEKILELNKRYYEENKEQVLEQHKRYRMSERGQTILFNQNNKRRQREQEQGRGITVEQWKEMFDFFGWRCAYSGKYLGGDMEGRTIDHIIPLSEGGLNEPWNCVPMYSNYNSSKHTSDMLDWYIQQEYYSEERLNKIYEWIEYAKNKWNI